MKDHKQILQDIITRIQNGDKSIPENISFENGRIIVKPIDLDSIEKDHEPIDIDNPEKYVMVHATSFFPRNHKVLTAHDGNNVVGSNIFIDKIYYSDLTVTNHRLTTHYTLNTRVKDNDGGSWKDKKYVVIEPLEPHLQQLLNLSENDSYTYGSMDLTNQAIILGSKDSLDEIPEEEQKSFLLIQIDGDNQEKGVNAVLKMLGYQVHTINPNDAYHKNSFESKFENFYSSRDAFVRIIKNQLGNFERNIVLSEKDIACLYSLLTHIKNSDALNKNTVATYDIGRIRTEELEELSKELNIPAEFIRVFTNLRYYYKK